MTYIFKAFYERFLRRFDSISKRGFRIPIATKLILSFLFIIILTSVIFIVAGIQLIGNRVEAEAQEKVNHDLNAAREIYTNKLSHINDVVRFTADRFFLKDALLLGNVPQTTDELKKIREREGLDFLSLTDQSGNVLLRTSNNDVFGDSQANDELVNASINRKEPVFATSIMTADDLRKESPILADMAHLKFIDTPKARISKESEETAGMVLKAAAPIFNYQNDLIGIVYGGVLLNRSFEIVDKIKQTVFQDMKYKGKDIGTATIFQEDVRISTNVLTEYGLRAIGTRVSEEVYNQVVNRGISWIGRAYVVNNWYISAYEPIKNINNKIIGILYVGILDEKYIDIRKQSSLIFLAITLMGGIFAIILAYLISRRISGSINRLVFASREFAKGNLDAKVEITSNDELHELADSFNNMANTLKERDERLKEFTRIKIMESERLAMIGQLAAGVAHELNNPLQGIVAYSHLLLEKMPDDNPARVSIKKIVNQASRCTEIIKGLLDFSRQRKPHKSLSNVNSIMLDCVSLVEEQAVFQNIQILKDLKDLKPVIIDSSQIQQVFMNMIINAAEAMDGSGKLYLATRINPLDNFIEIEFTDTGHGISEQNMMNIFDPFFTTKEPGHGVGLGLAISYGIIKEHRGTISVESEIDKGTTFIIRLPLAVEEVGVENEKRV